MLPRIEWLLVVWSLLAAGWSAIAIALVWRSMRRPPRVFHPVLSQRDSSRTLSIFKPLPPLGDLDPSQRLIAALESFVSQLDDNSEMLLGIEAKESGKWQPIIERWEQEFPAARLTVCVAPQPSAFANPKISWNRVLAPRARGEIWFWSDADVALPPAGLRTLLEEFDQGLLTCPYVVRRLGSRQALLDALFVNAEFLPGVLLLSRIGVTRFALGAAMIFEAKAFQQRVRWETIGSALADDFALGNILEPVTVSRVTLETIGEEPSWGSAFHHYLRWHKTVRWCRPAGYAAQIMVLPLAGWLLFTLLHPANPAAWLGLAATALIEVFAATLLFRFIGCEVRPKWLMGAWCILRPLAWLACWLPWPVVWQSSGQIWWSPYRIDKADSYDSLGEKDATAFDFD